MLFFVFHFLFFIFFVWLAWRKPIFALALVIGLLPSYQLRFKIWFLPITVLEAMILILFIVWFFHQRIYKSITNIQICKFGLIRTFVDKITRGWGWLIFAWLAVATLAMLIAPDLRVAAGVWKAYFIEPILLLIVLLNLVKTKKGVNLVLAGLFCSAFYVSVWAIAQKLFGFGGVWSLEQWPSTKIWRATGPFPYPNALGLYLAPIIVLLFGQIISEIQKQRSKAQKIQIISGLSILFCFSFLTLFLARSEGAILGILVGLIFYLFLILKNTSMLHSMVAKIKGLILSQGIKILLGIILLLIVVCLLFILPKSQFLFQKITFQDFSGQLRLNMWQETIEMIKDRPIFGAGLAGYQTVMTKYHQIPWAEIYLYPHNLFLNFWSELGLIGLIIFILILIKFFFEGFNKIIQTIPKRDAVPSGLCVRTYPNAPNKIFNFLFLVSNLSAMVALLTHGAFDVPYFKNDLAILFWLIIGLSIWVNKNLTETEDIKT